MQHAPDPALQDASGSKKSISFADHEESSWNCVRHYHLLTTLLLLSSHQVHSNVKMNGSTNAHGMSKIDEVVARSEIRAVLDRYGILARDDSPWDDVRKCFGKDAVYRIPSGKELPVSRLEEVLQGGSAEYIRHHVTTADIKFISATEAKVETNFIAITDTAWPDHWGCWKDSLKVQEDGQWKIQDRQICVDSGVPEGWYMTHYGKMHKEPVHHDVHTL